MLQLEDLKNVHVAIATPCYGGQVFQNYLMSVINLIYDVHKTGLKISFIIRGGDSLIPRTRNSIVAEFLATEEYTHLLWIDADIGFTVDQIYRLILIDREVTAGVYPLKKIKWPENGVPEHTTEAEFNALYTGYPFNPIGNSATIDQHGFVEVLDAPTGLMLIKKEALLKMVKHYPGLRYIADEMMGLEALRDKIANYHYRFFDVMTEENGRYLSEDYAFCTTAKCIITTEDGDKTMKEIVDEKYTGKVLSLNSAGEMVWNNVVDHIVRRNGRRGLPETKKIWVKINTDVDNNTKRKLVCTSDHKVLITRDVMSPTNREFVEAADITGTWCIRKPDQRGNHNENPLYNPEQVSVMIGTLLGDASIGRFGQLSFTHSTKQRAYLNHKASILGANTGDDKIQTGFGAGNRRVRAIAPVNGQTKYLRRILYKEKKSISEIVSYIDEIALAFWYMDDGCLHKNGGMMLSSYGFTFEEHQILVRHFKDKWNISPTILTKRITYNGEMREYNYLAFGTADSIAISRLIAPYIIPEMEYKLPEEFRGGVKKQINNQPLDFAASFVKTVVTPKNQSLGLLYDIEVEKDHNFVANGTVIHNCRRWQNIGGKIWVDVRSDLTHQGGHLYRGNLLNSLMANDAKLRKEAEEKKAPEDEPLPPPIQAPPED